MSSGSYSAKPFEEIRAKVEIFIENYEKNTGQKLSIQDLLSKVKALSQEKEKELFANTFGTLHPKNLMDCDVILKELISSAELQKSNTSKHEDKNLTENRSQKQKK